MKFSALDTEMRVYETAHDICIPPNIFIVARLDGRSFTRLTEELEKPFDEHFSQGMIDTMQHLLDCGFNMLYAYTQSDEISLLLHPDDDTFARKERKLNSVLAGEASAKFSYAFGEVATFDCRLSWLPNKDLVVRYFQWRSLDAFRNALSAYAYWHLRDSGLTARQATKRLDRVSSSEKHEMLFGAGINPNDLPLWQKRGIGACWEEYIKRGYNPKAGQEVEAIRRRVKVITKLPDDYDDFIRGILDGNAIAQ